MKIEGRRARIVEALKEGRVPQGASPAEVKEALDAFSAEERSAIEKRLGQDFGHTVEAPTVGKKLHDIRAEKRKPWWSGLGTAGTPLHPEPARDVEVHGEKIAKDDLASMLRSIAR